MHLPQAFKRLAGLPLARMKPRFIIIGAQKAGTSALFRMLSKHPQLLPPTHKEIHFFNEAEAYAKGLPHYLSHFPVQPVRQRRYTFEATPAYLFHAESTAPRIKQLLPKVTCIAILRDPVKRAYSAWNMFRDFRNDPQRVHLHDPRSFQQAVEDELAGRTEHIHHRYLARGHSAVQLAHFQAHFPPEQLLIRAYPELKRDAHAFVQDLCRHLGLPPMPNEGDWTKVRANTRPYPEKLDPGLAAELYLYFAPGTAKLKEVLGYEPDLQECG